MRPAVIILSALLAAGSAVWAAAPAHSTAAAPAKGTPADAAALYQDITRRYLAGDWESLAADLPQKQQAIRAMDKDQQADVTYIKQAIADGRPAWWNQVKQGANVQISNKLWQKTLKAQFDPSRTGIQVTTAHGQKTVVIGWAPGEMDSPDQAEHGFSKGDLAYVNIWSTLESVDVFEGSTFLKLNDLSDAAKKKLFRYAGVREMITAAYYGTPRARRWAAFLSLDAYVGDHGSVEEFIQRKPFGAFLVQEIVGHPGKYPSFRPGRVNPNNAEASLAANLMNQMAGVSPTFAEDKALREAVKAFSSYVTTGVTAAGKVLLPNKEFITLDPAEDAAPAEKRNSWLLNALQHPETAPATHPS